ncbi:MAG: START-like domain-containing protein [Porphyromonadaceae bacterium]|nr:MAG: START-like domain-containing protein [Porphyromonadaceae bacterium]
MLLSARQNSHVRFHWKADADEPTFFEMRILVSELTHGRTLKNYRFRLQRRRGGGI